MKYSFMEEYRGVYRLTIMCKALKVSRSGYYLWRIRKPSIRQKANEQLLEQIREAYRESRSTYGSPRITDALHDQGIVCGKNRVARVMSDNGIRAKIRRRFKRMTDSQHKYPVAANLLLQGNQKEHIWSSDITFIPTREGWLYVSAIMDVCKRKIIGLSMKDQLTQDLTTDALIQAVKRQEPSTGLIHHSDRGRQYASYAYQGLLERFGITCSMSRKGHCYDNPYIESFWSTLKRELVHGQRYRTRREARLSIFEYIEVFYNRIRKHSSLGYKSPEQYGKLLCEI
jgi:putative transposase